MTDQPDHQDLSPPGGAPDAGSAAERASGTAARADLAPEPGPAIAAANPGQLVVDGVEDCLALAATWHAWDGRPIPGTIDGKPNTWTPCKALRRINDHLIDHLHEAEALLAGAEPIPDTWHGRIVTLDGDWARFTEPDYDEACSRLRRLGRWYLLRYEAAGPDAWDEPRGEAWTLREIAEHVAGVRYYADEVGDLLAGSGGAVPPGD